MPPPPPPHLCVTVVLHTCEQAQKNLVYDNTHTDTNEECVCRHNSHILFSRVVYIVATLTYIACVRWCNSYIIYRCACHNSYMYAAPTSRYNSTAALHYSQHERSSPGIPRGAPRRTGARRGLPLDLRAVLLRGLPNLESLPKMQTLIEWFKAEPFCGLVHYAKREYA